MTPTIFLNKIITWLESNRLINLVLIIAYFAAMIFMHDPFVQLSIWIEHNLTIETYNLVVEIIFVLIILLLVNVLFAQLRVNFKNLKLEIAYLFITIILIGIHSRFMFDSNIEVVHSLAYTILAFLIFPLTKRFGATIFFTLPFMLIDEWYQYKILYPFLDYFDLNDIMMDTYGCGLAMATLMILGVQGQLPVEPLWKRAEFIALVSSIVIVLVVVKLCLLAPYASDVCSNTLLVINQRMTEEPFLRPHPTHNVLFHVMKPLEALIAIASLHFFYFGLDSFRKNSLHRF